MNETLQDLLERHTGWTSSQLTPSTHLEDDLGVDSVQLFAIFVEMERTLGRRLPVDLLASIETVGDLDGWMAG